MSDSTLTGEDVVVAEAVRQATYDVAAALAESPQFQAFEQARERLRQDVVAQQALDAYETKFQSLQALLRLNAVSDEDQHELERLRRTALDRPSVVEYSQALEDLKRLCQAVNDSLSALIGLDFASAAGVGGCC